MKLAIFVLVVALVITAYGHPLGSDNEESTNAKGRIIPFITKTVKNKPKALFQIGKSLVTTSKTVVHGLGSIIQNGDIQGPILCTSCKAAVDALRFQISAGREDEIYSMIESTCVLLNIQTKNVCKGIANLFGPELLPILKSDLESPYICSFLLTKDCIKINLPEWEIALPPVQNQVPQQTSSPPANGSKLKVLQVTDSHFDKFYAPGAKIDCGEPLCCRIQNGFATDSDKGAGKWGNWNCDIPERTLDNMLEHAATTHPDIDYILWTGDIPAHDIWNQTKQANLESLRATAAKLKRLFPKTPVFPAVGNHEAAPTDIFPYPGAEKSASWLYDELDKEWRYWLPANTSQTIRKGAFYTALIKPGFRIVSLNTNYCYHRNWWLMINNTDPADQLKWLVDVLQKAETDGEKVQIIAHIPPGQPDCLPTWRDNYYRIVSRFRNTIVNHFFGHTHKDEFEIYYDEKDIPVGVGYIAPSVTTYTDLNPGYRIYYVDGDREGSSRVVLDFENWIMDLQHANKFDEPKWSKSYSAREEFQMKSLSPKDWNDLYKEMKTNDRVFQLYYKHSNKDSPLIVGKPCTGDCKKAALCVMRSCDKYN